MSAQEEVVSGGSALIHPVPPKPLPDAAEHGYGGHGASAPGAVLELLSEEPPEGKDLVCEQQPRLELKGRLRADPPAEPALDAVELSKKEPRAAVSGFGPDGPCGTDRGTGQTERAALGIEAQRAITGARRKPDRWQGAGRSFLKLLQGREQDLPFLFA